LIRDTDSIWESSAETGQMSRSAQLVGVLGTLTARNRKLRLPDLAPGQSSIDREYGIPTSCRKA